MLVGILVLVSIALCITLGILLFGSGRGSAPGPSFQQKLDAQIKARESAESELDRRRAELEEQRSQLAELKEQLKHAKKKLFDQREGDRDGREIAKARGATERMASVQLDSVRSELATALAEIEKMKKESGDRPGNFVSCPTRIRSEFSAWSSKLPRTAPDPWSWSEKPNASAGGWRRSTGSTW